MINPIHRIVQKFGFDIIRYKGYRPGRFPIEDMSKLISTDQPLIFDVGANIGQTLRSYKTQWPKSIIHSFEPSPTTFAILSQNYLNTSDVRLWNMAMGSSIGEQTLFENTRPMLSSFLPLGEIGGGRIILENKVSVNTIDQFCCENNIEQIDICKIDTQGYDFEVIKGAEKTIEANKVGLLYFEIIIDDQYIGLPSLTDVFDFLNSHSFKLVTLYGFSYLRGLASETNALFIHQSYLHKPYGID